MRYNPFFFFEYEIVDYVYYKHECVCIVAHQQCEKLNRVVGTHGQVGIKTPGEKGTGRFSVCFFN